MERGNFKNLVMYSGRMGGRNVFLHEWFLQSIPNLKKGWTMGVPVKDGVALFKFCGIKKPNKPIIIFDEEPTK